MKDLAISDDQLIFLISLPRSGSTMLQKILGSHSDIYTRSEPWIMLHPLYAMKNEGIDTRYNAVVAAEGVRDFIKGLPVDGEDYYYHQLCQCYLSLYGQYLQRSGKQRFLDKTPRYYEIFDELQCTFPNAKFIILYRNPLAVFSSILQTWIKGRYEMLNSYKGDLEDGIEFLQRDFSGYSNTYTIRFEKLLIEPERQTKALFRFLELPNQQECIRYGKASTEKWKYGDPETVYKRGQPDVKYADAWLKQLANPESWKLISDFMQMLGKSRFDHLGYSFEEAEKVIADAWQQYPELANVNLSLYNFLRSDKENLLRTRNNVALLSKNNKELQETICELETSLEQIRQNLRKKEQDISVKDNDLKQLRQSLQQKEQDISVKDNDLKQVRQSLQQKEQVISTKENDLEELRKSLQLKEQEISVKNNDLVQVRQNLEQKEQEISVKNNDLVQVRQNLEQKEQEISAKNNDLIEAEIKIVKCEEHLGSLLFTLDKLTQHKAILSPKSKYCAYKNVLKEYRLIKKFRNS